MKASLGGFSIGAAIIALYVSVFLAVEVQPVLFGFTFQQQVAGLLVLLLLILNFNILKQLDKRSFLVVLIAFGVFGVLLSGFLTYAHMQGTTSALCPSTNGDVPCDIVTQSKWAEIFGIPTAVFGFIGYLAVTLLLFSKLYPKQVGHMVPQLRKYISNATNYYLILASLALLFTIYLNYIQFVKLMTLCMLCELSAITVILLFIGALLLKWRGQ